MGVSPWFFGASDCIRRQRDVLPIVGDVSLRVDRDQGFSCDRAAAIAGPCVDRGVTGCRHRDDVRTRILATPRGRARERATRIGLVADEIGADEAPHELAPRRTARTLRQARRCRGRRPWPRQRPGPAGLSPGRRGPGSERSGSAAVAGRRGVVAVPDMRARRLPMPRWRDLQRVVEHAARTSESKGHRQTWDPRAAFGFDVPARACRNGSGTSNPRCEPRSDLLRRRIGFFTEIDSLSASSQDLMVHAPPGGAENQARALPSEIAGMGHSAFARGDDTGDYRPT